MKNLGRIEISSGDVRRSIELYEGDLTALPAGHDVDILIVSAFPDNYLETGRSLIGALNRSGLSIRELAADKAMDLRSKRSCWLSKPVGGRQYQRVLCFEPLQKGSPPAVVDDIFDSLHQLLLGEFRNASVAMPMVSTGDMGMPVTVMLPALLDAAVERLRIGLPLSTLKIVEIDPKKAAELECLFREYISEHGARFVARPRRTTARRPPTPNALKDAGTWDCFVSYSRRDTALVDAFIELLRNELPGIRVFRDSDSLRVGSGWIGALADAIDSSRLFVAIFSPDYFDSTWCRREFEAAIIRSDQGDDGLLYPIYLREDKEAPSLYLTFDHVDCIEADVDKLKTATEKLVVQLKQHA